MAVSLAFEEHGQPGRDTRNPWDLGSGGASVRGHDRNCPWRPEVRGEAGVRAAGAAHLRFTAKAASGRSPRALEARYPRDGFVTRGNNHAGIYVYIHIHI